MKTTPTRLFYFVRADASAVNWGKGDSADESGGNMSPVKSEWAVLLPRQIGRGLAEPSKGGGEKLHVERY